jgi:NitT/TauT family transport system permease protein
LRGGRATVKYRATIRRISGVFVFFALWYLVTDLITVPYLSRIPSLRGCIREAFSYLPTEKFLTNFVYTLARVYIGFILGALLGVPLGVMMGWKRRFRWIAFPLFELLRPIPILAWLPLSVIMFTVTEYSVLWLIFLGAFFPVALNSYHGVSTIPVEQLRAALSLGTRGKDILFKVILPAASPAIYLGMVIAMGLTWVVVVAAEMVAGGYGLGYMTWEAYILAAYDRIIVGMGSIGFAGWMCSVAIRKLADKAMPWRKIFG